MIMKMCYTVSFASCDRWFVESTIGIRMHNLSQNYLFVNYHLLESLLIG